MSQETRRDQINQIWHTTNPSQKQALIKSITSD